MTEIEKLLKTEGKNVEFKLERPQKDVTFLKTVVAFANCQGGRFVFGIRNEDHAIIGMEDETLFQDMDTITNIISDNCEPAIIPNVYPMTLNDKSLIVVEINIGRQRPYYVKALGMMEGTYIRVAAETRKAEEYMIKELMFEGAHRFFDKTVCLGLEASDDEINALCHSLQETASRYHKTGRRSKSIREVTPNQLLSWGVLTRKENQIVPTNAFALLTGHYLLPTMTQCAVFKGTMKGNFIDKREYEGPIQQQQEEAYQFVLRNIKLGARIKGLYRQDVYEIPPDAIREILIDAVVHRSYLATGNIQVALYDDRLEIVTPGKLPIDQTIDAMKSGFSKIRNEAIAKAFAYMGLIEAWGSGIPKINLLLKEAGLQEMEISGGDFWVKFTIYRNLKFDPMATKSNVGVENKSVGVEGKSVGVEGKSVGVEGKPVGVEGKSVGVEGKSVGVEGKSVGVESKNVVLPQDRIGILQMIQENPHITAKELATKLHTTTRTAERIFRQLKQSGKIRREGSDRYGHWIVLE
ncbi:MAG: putative DNA binding domain-containing protein [Victivallales bacterium]|nr:putative DNA binding domain-containing protein [Victivallales bacterium]